MTECRGYDVSQFQSQTFAIWKGMQFGIARAAYGNRLDSRVLLHVDAMRHASVKVGLYHFFCATVSVTEQLAAFRKIWTPAKPDLIPWIDVEDYPGHKVTAADLLPLCRLVDLFRDEFGPVGLYLSQAYWIRLGRPTSLLALPLWVPHWPKNGARARLAKPATPGNKDAVLWQCMVGPQPWGSVQNNRSVQAIDQDLAPNGLDSILVHPAEHLDESIRWEDLTEADWHEHHFGRDHTCDEPDP